MYPNERDFATLEYQREHRMKHAEMERLIASTFRKVYARRPIHQRMLVGFGTWLELLGYRLKSHYVEIAELEIQHTTFS